MFALQLFSGSGASSDWLDVPSLVQLASGQGCTVAQLLLNWAVSQGVSVIPSARSRKHMAENLRCCERPLPAEVLDFVSQVGSLQQRTIEPDPRFVFVPGVPVASFGGPVPPSHAHLNLFGGIEQFHAGSLRKQCWGTWKKPYPCCSPEFGPEGLSSCWDSDMDFAECCLPAAYLKIEVPDMGLFSADEDLDFLVVGAGSAGSIAASRLARKGFKVLLLESGGEGLASSRGQSHPNPSAADQLQSWFVHTVEWSLGEVLRTTQLLHGRGLGGSSAVNGRIYTRTALPFEGQLVAEAYADVEADLRLSLEAPAELSAWQKDLARGLAAANVPFCENASMGTRPAVGPVQRITGCRHGGPLSAYHCAMGAMGLQAGNVKLLQHAHVDRLLVAGGTALGVEVGKVTFRSRFGVVLSAGAVQTPSILVRSGIGNRADLQRLGIGLKVESPHVGFNLQDHPYLPFRISTRVSCDHTEKGLYAFYSNVSNIAQSRKQRMFELQLIPHCRGELPTSKLELKGYLILLKGKTSGRVVVRSGDPRDPPGILQDPFAGEGADAWQLLEGLRDVYRLLKFYWRPAGPSGPLLLEPAFDSLMENGFGGQYCAQHLGLWQHPMGSARIGPVLDANLRVRGVKNLYVADASALPDWALAGHPDAGIRAVGSLAARFAAEEVSSSRRGTEKMCTMRFARFMHGIGSASSCVVSVDPTFCCYHSD